MTKTALLIASLLFIFSCNKKGSDSPISKTKPKPPVTTPQTPDTTNPVTVPTTPENPNNGNSGGTPVVVPEVPVVEVPVKVNTWSLFENVDQILKEIQNSDLDKLEVNKEKGFISLSRELDLGEIDNGSSLTDRIADELDKHFKNTAHSELVSDFQKNSDLYNEFCLNESTKGMKGFDDVSYTINNHKSGFVIFNNSTQTTNDGYFASAADACKYLTNDQFAAKYHDVVSKSPESYEFPLKYESEKGSKSGTIYTAANVVLELHASRNVNIPSIPVNNYPEGSTHELLVCGEVSYKSPAGIHYQGKVYNKSFNANGCNVNINGGGNDVSTNGGSNRHASSCNYNNISSVNGIKYNSGSSSQECYVKKI